MIAMFQCPTPTVMLGLSTVPSAVRQGPSLKSVPPVISNLSRHGGKGLSLDACDSRTYQAAGKAIQLAKRRLTLTKEMGSNKRALRPIHCKLPQFVAPGSRLPAIP